LAGFESWKTRTKRNPFLGGRGQPPEDRGLFKDLPEEFKDYFKHVRSLNSNETLDYAYLRRLFRSPFCSPFHRNGFEYDYIFGM
jgi:hypothetical protein